VIAATMLSAWKPVKARVVLDAVTLTKHEKGFAYSAVERGDDLVIVSVYVKVAKNFWAFSSVVGTNKNLALIDLLGKINKRGLKKVKTKNISELWQFSDKDLADVLNMSREKSAAQFLLR
jgi:hypothetical protein